MLEPPKSILVLVDVQGKLAGLMQDKEQLYANLQRMILGAQALQVPILWMEQTPQHLGPTIAQIAELLPDARPMPKSCFSCCGSKPFMAALEASQRRQVLLMGIEAHICIVQTALELLEHGYHVEVIADAVSSRAAENRQLALERMRSAGVTVTSTEMALYELLKAAEGPAFKAILKLVR